MAFRTKSFGLVALVALSTLALAAQAGPLIRKPKVGEEHKYRLKVNIDLGGTEGVFTALVAERVTEVGTDNTYTIESTRSDIKVVLNGQEMEGAGDQGAGSVSSVHNTNGTIKEIRGDQADASAYRLSNLSVVYLPGKEVKVGDEWTLESAADEKTGAVGFKASYKIVGEEKVGSRDTWKITLNSKETSGDAPATADATVWLDKTEAIPVKVDGKWGNAPIPGLPVPVNATVSMNLE